MSETVNRRRFIESLLYLVVGLFSGILLFRTYRSYRAGLDFDTLIAGMRAKWRHDDPLDTHEQQSLQRYVDLLIPDDISPGAVKLGVDQNIISRSLEDPDYRQALRRGLIRIDGMARNMFGRPFNQLKNDQAGKIISMSEEAKRYSAERRLFEQLREDSFGDYYAMPDSWRSLCYTGPPQPRGFSDYKEPPVSCEPS